MFRKIGDKFRNFMLGRYGSDRLGTVLLGCGIAVMLVITVLSRWYPQVNAFMPLSYIPLIWCMFRMYSRNLEKRRRENAAFVGFFKHLRDREHRYYRCPKCRQSVRVPRDRGKINIRCPRCSTQFIKKT